MSTRTGRPPDKTRDGKILAPWREIEVDDRIKALVRPIIAARLEWLRAYATERPERAGMPEAELVAASRTWRRKLGDIERRLAAACSVRWDVRAAMPTRLDYDRETRTFTWDCRFYFFVDGVRINFEEWNQNYCTPVLYGENWRAFDIGANKT